MVPTAAEPETAVDVRVVEVHEAKDRLRVTINEMTSLTLTTCYLSKIENIVRSGDTKKSWGISEI